MNIHGCELFPEPIDVFADRVDDHRLVLLPFMVMPLSLIVPGSSIKVPWVIPHEPYEGAVGQETKKHHSFFSRENWIGFHLVDGKKLRFDSDLAFFMKHQIDRVPPKRRTIPADEEGDAYCSEAHQQIEQRYERCKEEYRRGPVALMNSHYVQNNRIHGWETFPGIGIFKQLGGDATHGNWASTQKKPYFDKDSNHPKPIDQKGRALIYLGAISPRINHANEVLGFINEDLNHVVFTFDFS